jgi:hypothetical protein
VTHPLPASSSHVPQTPEEHPMFISFGAIVIIVIIVLAVLFMRRR